MVYNPWVIVIPMRTRPTPLWTTLAACALLAYVSTVVLAAPRGEYKSTITTLFWVGEKADASNDYIANDESYWDEEWQEHFGGVDDPLYRCGYHPCMFTPRENPFYVALPYGEFKEGSSRYKTSAAQVPWASVGNTPRPLLKNRWVEVRYGTQTCYGQWQDVGPGESDDFAYVFDSAAMPQNSFGLRAGLDISPALWTCLGLETNATTSWRFIEERHVPEGPWKDIVTTSGITWK